MTQIAGSPDFISQQGSTFTFLASHNVNTGLVDNFDITGLLDPSMQALVLAFNPSNAAPSSRIGVTYQAGDGAHVFQSDYSVVGPNTTAMVAIDAQIALAGTLASGQLAIAAAHGDAPTTGVLHIWAVTNPPQVFPQRKWELSGQMEPPVNVNVGAGATVAVIPARGDGYYNRIRQLGWAIGAAPAAATSVAWLDTLSGAGIIQDATSVAVNQAAAHVIDISTVNGLSFINRTSVTVTAIGVYEIWPM